VGYIVKEAKKTKIKAKRAIKEATKKAKSIKEATIGKI